MESTPLIRCRVAACPKPQRTGWLFYLINDGDDPLEQPLLYEVGYEWGSLASANPVEVRVADLSPGKHALVWEDTDCGEGRMELVFRVHLHGREAKIRFEFPKLYKLADQYLKPVEGLGKHGYVVAAETQAR